MAKRAIISKKLGKSEVHSIETIPEFIACLQTEQATLVVGLGVRVHTSELGQTIVYRATVVEPIWGQLGYLSRRVKRDLGLVS